jgi:hypothetical protein
MKLFKTLETEIYKQTNAEFRMKFNKWWEDAKYWVIPISGIAATVLVAVIIVWGIQFREIDGRDYDRLADYDKSYSAKIPGFNKKIKEAASNGKINEHEYNEIVDMLQAHWAKIEATSPHLDSTDHSHNSYSS